MTVFSSSPSLIGGAYHISIVLTALLFFKDERNDQHDPGQQGDRKGDDPRDLRKDRFFDVCIFHESSTPFLQLRIQLSCESVSVQEISIPRTLFLTLLYTRNGKTAMTKTAKTGAAFPQKLQNHPTLPPGARPPWGARPTTEKNAKPER